MKLIPNWRRAPRMLSMWAMGSAATLQAAWLGMPQDMRDALPVQAPTLVAYAVLGLTGAGMVLRLLYQPSLHEAPPQ